MKRLMELGDISNIKKCSEISGISIDSRTIQRNEIFVAIKGELFDGHDFIEEAARKGATVVIASKDYNCRRCRAPIIRVPDTREALAVLAGDFCGNPSEKVRVVGITGTNGKTTVLYLTESIFRAAGRRVGRLGTIDYKIGDKLVEAPNTTPSSLELNKLLKEMVDCSCDYAVMEVSSHALAQRRTGHVIFSVGVFTNISPEHLDYHKNFKQYLNAKKILFSNLRPDAGAVLNIEDPNFESVRRAVSAKNITSFGIEAASDITARGLKMSLEGSEFLLGAKNRSIVIKSRLIGRHNVSNMLAAAGAALMEGIGLDSIKKGLENLDEVPGRLELVKNSKDILIFIDFAHTDDALKKVLEILNAVKKNKLIVVFGCGGERDRLKRPRMGNVAARLADYVIITSDNPRSEDPALIAEEVRQGIGEDFKDYQIILDRAKAIQKALHLAKSGDIVLVAGKGHEKYQIIGSKKIPFSDREMVREAISCKL